MRNTLIKLTYHDETKKKAHNSQIVRAAESIQKLPRIEDSSRGYKKAPDGERDKETFRAPLDDQNNLEPTSFDPLLFFKHSRSVFQYRTLVALRRLRLTFPGDCP